ncbi:UDP-3-O-acyl-N-acetylglucosamine deacetylase [Thalassorhabdomicrobium marinisediminis]|uniref:UDP-3-O-acyl-N-acetylglucosamine deacetylase n=1 Tax=Thalassorhabdomicrobium marinisediminis TaxID=2170577 RepID=A0A2T7FXW9_9RHOB|nr:UDP-3-O-acyl-N-acetylglucosamine deacetylase [Thalassorhabdomicrobium marinisediminis]PVA07021.1 UDP-3-O-[3-hydroxymyristoyl] N-acetylglucosamine deacetylase [Thalassorhabdomicrobium marinisediminis]
MQTTIDTTVAFEGKGLHLGEPVSVVVHPAAADHGIVFRRADVAANTPAGANADIPALWSNVIVSPLNTRIENAFGTSVSTIEHIMAALAGCGIHNALIEVTGPEVPILDGSAAPFVAGFLRAGVRRLNRPLRVIEVRKPVSVTVGDATARLDPSDTLHIRFEIDFTDRAIGHQEKTLNMSNGAFVRELCDSRTFCRSRDVDAMRANGLALGGTLENAVVVEGGKVLSPGGLRHADEAVRHKMLDALGDLYTAGAPILGRYTGSKAGHAVTNALLRALFDDPDAWGWAEVDAQTEARLPGVGLRSSDAPQVL